ncbi:transposase, partial [Bradyrhizobium arachidis]
MDSNKFSAQIERFEVVETGRRRRWTDGEKLKIVLESLQAPRAVSSTARRYGISRSLLLTWRRSFGTRTSNTEQPQPAFVPAMVM